MTDYWNVNVGASKKQDFKYIELSNDETQGATAANQQKNESVVQAPPQKQVDGFNKTVNGEQTAEQKNDASKRKESQNHEMQNTAFFSKVQTKIGSDEALYRDQNAQLNQMIDAVNHGRYEEAAAKYEMLKQSGVLDGITDKPPFLAEMKSETANKKELEADVERARNSVNSNDGVDKMIEYYKAHDTKKELHEAYDAKLKELGGSELHGAGKMARANKKNLKSLEKQQALEDEGVVVGDKKAYKKARKEAENKDAVSYMSEGGMNVAQKINASLLKQGKPTILKKDGTIDVDAAQEYARQRVSTAGDRADKNEIAELAKEFSVSKKDVKAFFKGINVDYQKNYTIPGIAAGVVAGTATLLNPLAGATVGAVAGATNVYTDVTTTNTIEKSSILNGDQVEESIKNKSETTTNVRKEEVPGSSGHRRLGFGDFLGAAATGVAVEELVRKVVNHDSQILKKNKTIENVLSDKPEKVVRKKSNQDKVRLIQGYDLSAKGYDAETAKQIKLALLSDAMGKGGKLNSRELNGVLAQLEAVPKKPEAPTQDDGHVGDNSGNDNTDNNTHEFDPATDGKNFKFGDRFWNDAMPNKDDPTKKGGWVTDKDGNFVTELAGERADEIGSFAVDNKILARHKNDKHKLENAPIQKGVEHDNAANANKAGATRYEYIHGLTNGNTRAVADAEYIAEVGVEEAAKNPRQVEIQDPTRGNKYVLERQENGQYKLVSAKRKDGTDLPRNDSQIYNMNALKKADKNDKNNVESGYEYQFFNAAGQGNGDGISVSDDVTAQIQADYAKKHSVKKGQRRR